MILWIFAGAAVIEVLMCLFACAERNETAQQQRPSALE